MQLLHEDPPPIRAIGTGPDTSIVVVRDGLDLRQWDFKYPLQDNHWFVHGLAFTPDGKGLATANANTTVYLLECP